MVEKIEKKRLARSLFHMMILIIAICVFFSWLRRYNDAKVIDFDRGWDIKTENGVYLNKDINSFEFEHIVKRGDKFELSNTVPTGAWGKYTVEFPAYLSMVSIEVAGKEVYSYGSSLYNKGRMPGSGYYRIRIPENAVGKKIKLTIVAGEDNAFSRLSDIRLVESARVITLFTVTNATNIFISVFLIVLGVILFILGIIYLLMRKDYEIILLIGLLSLVTGTWTLCNTRMVQIFSSNKQWNMLMEYLALYFAPIPFMRIIDILFRDKESENVKWKDRALYGSILTLSAFFVITLVLHVTNIWHVSQMLPVFHVLSLVCMVLVIASSYKPYSSLKGSNKMIFWGIAVLFISAVMDLIRFNLQVYVGLGEDEFFDTSLLPMGTFVFIILLLSGYIIYLYEHYISQAEKTALQSRAFKDALTGLYNRAFFEKEVFDLCEHFEEYGIISMDLNGLKHVNDTMGHASGDRLLVEFAGILEESFKGAGDVIRMGGDEFLILIRQPDPRKIAGCLINMDKLERERSRGLPFEIRTAYGEAYSSECKGHDKEAVYRLADSRMYDMKKRSKLKN